MKVLSKLFKSKKNVISKDNIKEDEMINQSFEEKLFEEKLLEEIISICGEITIHNFVPIMPNHETYVAERPFQYAINLLEKYEELQKEMETSDTSSIPTNPKTIENKLVNNENLTKIENYKNLLENILEEIKTVITKVDNQVIPFDTEAGHLKNDILLFAQAVNEASAKYKLSPDWEGKKTPLMQIQKKLEERRNIYEEKNKEIEKLLDNAYHEYAVLYVKLQDCCNMFWAG
ncbi:MAG: hypothetical protein R3Y24_07500 [Eubacteriales bacterium]